MVCLSLKGLGGGGGWFISPAATDGVRVGGPVPFIAASTISAPVAVKSTAIAVNSAARVSASIVVVAVIKRTAPRVVPIVIMNYDSVMPIGPPVMPAPAITAVEADSEADSERGVRDRKSTRLNSSHTVISYAVFCLKKKNRHESKDIPMASRSRTRCLPQG